MRIAFIVNSKISQRIRINKDLERFKEMVSGDTQVHLTEHAGHATQLAKTLCSNNVEIIIAVGGDGTLNEVVNGVMQSKNVNPDSISSIGILPYGSGNDFVKTIKATNNIDKLALLIDQRSLTPIDLGKISFEKNGKLNTRYFINIADLGIGSEVVLKTNNSKMLFGPTVTYLSAITRTFLSYKKSYVSCVTENFEWNGKLMALIVANGKYFGSGLCIAPEATLDDGLFQIVVIGDISFREYLVSMGKIRKGGIIDHPEVHYYQCKSIDIDPIDGITNWEADGEFGSEIPVNFQCLNKAINFVMEQL